MKIVLAALLLCCASLTHASPCIGPEFDSFATVSVNGGVAHFDTFTFMHVGTPSCGEVLEGHVTLDVDFGDGQSLHLAYAVPTFLLSFDHTYSPGSYVATVNETAQAIWNSAIFGVCGTGVPGDCDRVPQTIPNSYSRSFNIISHAPEPTTYAMMLVGLGLLIARRSSRRTAGLKA